MTTRNVKVEYDKDYDILYLIVGSPVIAEAEPLIEGVYVRRDILTEKVAGAIIEHYSEQNRNCLSKLLPIGLGEYLPPVE